MFAEFKHSLRRMRGTIIGWGTGLFLYGLMMAFFYSSIAEMGDQFTEMLELYPAEILAFMPSIEEFTSPIGYIDTYFFTFMTLIIGFFAISACAKLLVGDEEKGILDLVAAHPVSRTGLYWGRLLGFLTATAAILLISWISWVLPAKSSGLDLGAVELLTAFIPLFGFLAFFGTLSLLLSMLLPSGQFAVGVSSVVLVGNFLLLGMSNINESLKPIYELSPFYFHQGADAINGLNWGWLGYLLGFSALFALLGWVLFQRREIRVGGEGGWRLPFLGKAKTAKE